jgi:hypothetical protein
VNKSLRNMGISVIVKNSSEKVLATLLALKMYIINPVIAEASITLKVAILCRELGLQMIELEGDAL